MAPSLEHPNPTAPLRPIYLDSHATTPLCTAAREAMEPYWTEQFGNPASPSHAYGWVAEAAVAQARASLAECLGATPEEIIFTSGATESNNLALQGLARHALRVNAEASSHSRVLPKRVLISSVEHKSVSETAAMLTAVYGGDFEIELIDVDRYGMVDLDHLRYLLKKPTLVVSVIGAQNEIGTIQPLESMGRLCRDAGALFHCDATQAFAFGSLSMSQLPVDLLSLSAHKIYGPKGMGLLYLRRRDPRVTIAPLFGGGGHERGLRSGTLPVPGILGFAAAAQWVREQAPAQGPRLGRLRDSLQTRLLSAFPHGWVNGHPTQRLPQNLSFTLPGLTSEAALAAIRGVALSAASACLGASPHNTGPSAGSSTLDKIFQKRPNLPPGPLATLRLSLSFQTTDEEIQRAGDILISGLQSRLPPS